jgi:secreted protein with Ig-like and vWFA domain
VRDAEYWISLTKGTATTLALNIMPRQMSAEEYRRRVAPLYEAGVEHLFFWDGAMGRSQHTGASHVMRRLGHKEEVADWVKGDQPSLAAPRMWLRNLGDWDFSYVSPG